MFGRDKTQTSQASTKTAPAPVVKADGKGRATPSRREAEQRNRKPLIGAPPAPKGATRAERKAVRKAQAVRNREDRAKQRQAMDRGDERALPARDKGPARRFVRDYVDSRRNLGEYFLPVALVCVVLGMINLNITKLGSLVALYLLVIAIFVNAMLLRRKMIKLVTAKFGADQAAGVGGYAVMRSLQLRRSRVPKPQVERGQHPK